MLRSSSSARSSAIAAGRVRTLSWISRARSSWGASSRSSSSDSSSPGRASSTGWVLRKIVGRSRPPGGELDRLAPEQPAELGLARRCSPRCGTARAGSRAAAGDGRGRAPRRPPPCPARAARWAGTPSSPGPRAAARAARACPSAKRWGSSRRLRTTVVGRRPRRRRAGLRRRRSGRRGTRSRRSGAMSPSHERASSTRVAVDEACRSCCPGRAGAGPARARRSRRGSSRPSRRAGPARVPGGGRRGTAGCGSHRAGACRPRRRSRGTSPDSAAEAPGPARLLVAHAEDPDIEGHDRRWREARAAAGARLRRRRRGSRGLRAGAAAAARSPRRGPAGRTGCPACGRTASAPAGPAAPPSRHPPPPPSAGASGRGRPRR